MSWDENPWETGIKMIFQRDEFSYVDMRRDDFTWVNISREYVHTRVKMIDKDKNKHNNYISNLYKSILYLYLFIPSI